MMMKKKEENDDATEEGERYRNRCSAEVGKLLSSSLESSTRSSRSGVRKSRKPFS
jgi:hypothetical protein